MRDSRRIPENSRLRQKKWGWVGFRRRAQLCEAQVEAELVQVPSLISASVSLSVERVRQHLYSARLSAGEMKRCT